MLEAGDFPLEQRGRSLRQQEHPADRVHRRSEAELLDAAQMEQLQVLPAPQEQPSQEPRRVSQQQVLEKVR